jgi:hypothetical protein
MSLTHVDPHVSEIVMVWIQSGDLLMVWIQISQKKLGPFEGSLVKKKYMRRILLHDSVFILCLNCIYSLISDDCIIRCFKRFLYLENPSYISPPH